jgi:hypothetical protein
MMLACLEERETTDLEANPEEIKSESGHQEVPQETIETLEDGYWDRPLAVERLRQPKKRTQGDGGSRKKLVAIRRRPAVPFLRHARDTVVRDDARTMLFAEPLKDGCSRRDVGRDLNATTA